VTFLRKELTSAPKVPPNEQIIASIKEQESGEKTADVCRRHGISSATFY